MDSDGTCENVSCQLQVNAARVSHFLDAKTGVSHLGHFG